MTAPTISNLISSVTYSRAMVNAYAAVLDSSVTFSDAEGNFNGGTVTLRGAGPILPEDQFGIRDQGFGPGLITVVGHNVNYGGMVIGSYTGGVNGTPLLITLNGNATNVSVDALIQNLTYGNTSASATADRDLVLDVRDAAGEDFGGAYAGPGFTDTGAAASISTFQAAPTLFDYDGDGDLDIFSGGDNGQIYVYKNNGLGAFTQQTGTANPFNGFDIGEGSSIAFADMNGDGLKDAFITDGLDGFAKWFQNSGNATFTDKGVISGFYRGDSQNARVAAYDADGDGIQDFVIGGYDGHLQVWKNNGNGTITAMAVNPFTSIVFPAGSYPSPSFGDIDGDGDIDLLVGNSNGYVLTYLNTNGVFSQLSVDANPLNTVAGFGNATPAAGDIDGDGDVDVIVGGTSGLTGKLEVFRDDGFGWGKVIHVTINPAAIYTGTTGADTFYCFTAENWTVNGGAGNDDLRGWTGSDTIIGANGDDELAGGAGVDILAGGTGHDLFRDTLANFNGDTITDFAHGDRLQFSNASTSTFTWSYAGGTLTFNGGTMSMAIAANEHLVSRAVVGASGVELLVVDPGHDFNGDGRSDMLWRNSSGAIGGSTAAANGSFVNNASVAGSLPTDWSIVGRGDFNGDGKDDILWRNTAGSFGEWLGQSTGALSNNAAAAYFIDPSYKLAGTGDFNGDGHDDILWRNTAGQMGEWLSNADGTFTNNPGVNLIVDPSWKVAGTADFNGDGIDDILWRNNSGQINEWTGQADGTFVNNATVNYFVDPVWKIVGTGDFNGDGYDDMLWRNSSTGQLNEWIGQSNGTLANNPGVFQSVGLDWHVVDIGDYNGDAHDDILWRNNSGQLGEWTGQADGSFANNAAVGGVLSTSLSIQAPDILFV